MNGAIKEQAEALRGFIPSSEGLLEPIRVESLLKGTVYEPGAHRRELMACVARTPTTVVAIWPGRPRSAGWPT